MKKKLIRITTVPISLDKLIGGQLTFMKSNYEVIGISSGGDKLLHVAKKEDIRVVPIEMSRQITPFKDLIALFKLYKLLKKESPFIVHSHTPKAGIIGMLAAKLANVPIRLHTVAGLPLLEAKGIKRKVLNIVEKITYGCATKVYPNSNGLKTIIIKNKLTKPEKLKVIANGSSNGIDTSYFNPQLCASNQIVDLKKKLDIQQDDFVFIFVGRLVGDKGINELITAFKTLQSSNKRQHSKLLLVGPLETALDPLLPVTLQEISNNTAIITVGYQDDVRPYFAIADVLVFPSYREGFPNVVLQAGAMDLPSIVTDINGCNEIINHGVNGWIVPPKDAEEVYKAMFYCIENPEILKEIRNNTRKIITTKFEQKMVWNALLHEYQKLEFELET